MTDPLHLGPGHGRKEACSIGWEERSHLHPHVPVVVDEVPKQKELKCNQGGISKREHRHVRLADIQKAKIVKGVTGSPNQEDIGRAPMKTIYPSLGHVRKETLSHLRSGILVSRGLGCLAT
ncbi:hypothetical protein Tco_0512239 [Tanacetum coccineum]